MAASSHLQINKHQLETTTLGRGEKEVLKIIKDLRHTVGTAAAIPATTAALAPAFTPSVHRKYLKFTYLGRYYQKQILKLKSSKLKQRNG